ncbi:MAG: hypothetical protein K6G78_01360 [bacterium]|nr:hypothetical protein [bacterium]
MKKLGVVLAVMLTLAMALAIGGCSGSNESDNPMVGTWEYSDTDNGMGAVYVLNDDGTGTYTMKVSGEEVTYDLEYEIQGNHLLVTYVNNEVFTEDDVFDSEFELKDDGTLIIKDSFGLEMTFVKQ